MARSDSHRDTLSLADIPACDAGWGAISAFALTYDGYAAAGDKACAEIANARRHDSLADLRTCLFLEQRRWHHFGDDPDEPAMAYLRELVEQIRARVAAGETR